MVRKIKLIFKIFLTLIIVFIVSIITLNVIINVKSNKYIYNDIDKLPKNNVALVLGTSRYMRDGSANKFFYNRIDAAVELYENNKVDYILVSGDNRSVYYNEPAFMRFELLKRGVPAKDIYLDYAGFRTYDSVIRCKEVFGQNSFTIVSQKFHNQRAVYIALSNNIAAVAFNAQDVDMKTGFRIHIREIFARAKVFIDLITRAEPTFLGEPVKIPN